MDNSKVSSKVAFWVGQIDTYEQQFQPWEKRSKEIIKRYKDERKDAARNKARFNILWSNVQTLHPAIYATPPNPNIDRRFDTDDDLGRYAALVLERSVSYFVKNDVFHKVMKQTTLDRLLPGRGVAWVRYVPLFEEVPQVTDDAESEEAPTLLSEDTVVDYVHWCDFGHTWARTWQEVRGVWRRVYMGRAELVKRFPGIGETIPLDAEIKGKDGEKITDSGKKAVIYEIWDKAKKKAIWLHKSMPDLLDEQTDPLGLKDFFPCPEPIYATLTNDDLIPAPDYTLYQDQALELDLFTGRIASISKSLKVAGVYDSTAEGLDRLLSEGVENKLIPVAQWAVLGQQGIKGVVSFFPLQEIIETLVALHQARDAVKNDIYEITGISDIVRGATKANETATAQQIKGQFASLRLDNQQGDVARFSRDLVVIMTEIIAKHFSIETIKKISGVKLLTEQEKQQIQMQQQQAEQMAAMAQQQGMEAPPAPPIDGDILELMEMPTWEQVEQLIRDDTARSFKIDIETDSTIKTDQEAEKEARMEFLTSVTGFLAQAVNIPPELRTLSMQMLLFGVRGFKVSREIETAFETAIAKIKRAEENPPPQPPSPEEIKAQAEQQKSERDMQIAEMKAQSDMQSLELKRQMEHEKSQFDQQRMVYELQLKQIDASMKEMDMRMKEMELARAEAEPKEENDNDVSN